MRIDVHETVPKNWTKNWKSTSVNYWISKVGLRSNASKEPLLEVDFRNSLITGS